MRISDFLLEHGPIIGGDTQMMVLYSGIRLQRNQGIFDHEFVDHHEPVPILDVAPDLYAETDYEELFRAERKWVVDDVGWYRLLHHANAAPEWLTDDEVAARLRISVDKLREMLKKLPPDSPHLPVVLPGRGSGARRQRRWRAQGVENFVYAVARLSLSPTKKPKRKKRPSRRRQDDGPVDWDDANI